MKKLVLGFILLFMGLVAHAQDILVQASGYEVAVKVEMITAHDIIYTLWDDQEGMKYSIPQSDVVMIRYANGEVQRFTVVLEESKHQAFLRHWRESSDFAEPKMHGYVYGGAAFTHAGGYAIDGSIGKRVKKYLYVGGEIGIRHLIHNWRYEPDWWDEDDNFDIKDHYNYFYMPMGCAIKGYLPLGNWGLRNRVYAYLNITTGFFIGSVSPRYHINRDTFDQDDVRNHVLNDLKVTGGYYQQISAGLDLKNFSFGLGMDCLGGNIDGVSGHFKVGYRLGGY